MDHLLAYPHKNLYGNVDSMYIAEESASKVSKVSKVSKPSYLKISPIVGGEKTTGDRQMDSLTIKLHTLNSFPVQAQYHTHPSIYHHTAFSSRAIIKHSCIYLVGVSSESAITEHRPVPRACL